MFEAAYRQRLEADLTRWQNDGVIAPGVGEAIRARLGPAPTGVNIPTVVAIVGALLIAAAFLAFVAANWTAIARPARFSLLLAGIAISYALAAWFDRQGRPYLADIGATVGSLIFGAAIALTGQMYHLSGDFSAGILLWAGGALVAAALTSARGALAVALVTGCVWSGMRVIDSNDVPHLPFILFWLITAAMAVAWNAPMARHLVALAALTWWILTASSYVSLFNLEPLTIAAAGAALMLGVGLMFATITAKIAPDSLRSFGRTLSNYGALAFVIIVAMTVVGILGEPRHAMPLWVAASAVAGFLLAVVAAAVGPSIGAAMAAIAIAIGVALSAGLFGSMRAQNDPWLAYAFALIAMLCLVVSGMLDDMRPRVVAGWIGLASAIVAITWAVEGSLLKRAAFLAIAGIVAVALASLLGRLKLKQVPA